MTLRARPSAPLPQSRPPSRRAAIPRSQIWLFWFLLLSVAGMSTFLIRLRQRADDRYSAAAQPLPLTAAPTAEGTLRLYLANDRDGSLVEKPISFPLPADPSTRARVVLEKLLEEYAAPDSTHPLTPGTGNLAGTSIEDVFLMPVLSTSADPRKGQLAIINLSPAFVHNHPSWIEPETLSLLSMIATLRANLPAVTEVRFLVDGHEKETLAGHADMTQTYLAGNTQMAGTQP